MALPVPCHHFKNLVRYWTKKNNPGSMKSSAMRFAADSCLTFGIPLIPSPAQVQPGVKPAQAPPYVASVRE